MPLKPSDSLSARQAKQIALAAQGFRSRPERAPSKRRLVRQIEDLGVIQIDSVNVVSRTHYLPLFSRLGAYRRSDLEEIAWGKKQPTFEYWGHEASLLPLELYPYFQWRMADARAGQGVWKGVAKFLAEQKDMVDFALNQIDKRGALSASEIEVGEKGVGGWWEWSDAKRAVEYLFWAGEINVVTRRASFERIYDLPSRVIPNKFLSRPALTREDAIRELVKRSAQALGCATGRDLRDYYRLGVRDTALAVAQLVEADELTAVKVADWKDTAYLPRDVQAPKPAKSHALLSPFDNAIWHRDRTERMFGVRVVLEIYTPAPKRIFGYYVLPFLEGEEITARVDLKADRKTSTLIVQSSHAEPKLTPETPERLAAELRLMADWLGLADIDVKNHGDLALELSDAVRASKSTPAVI